MEVIALPLKEDSGKGHTIVEGNRAAVNAPVLEVLSLTRRFGEHTAVDSLTVAGSITNAHYIFPRVAAWGGPELESAGACRRALRRNLGSGAVFHPVPDHCFGGQDARTLHGHRPGVNDAALLCQQRDLSGVNHAVLAPDGGPCEPVDLRGRRVTGADVDGWSEIFRASSGFQHSAGSGSHHGYDRREVVPAGGDLIRIRIVFGVS